MLLQVLLLALLQVLRQVLLAFDLPLQAFAEVIRVDLNFCEVLYVCYMCAICVGAHDVGAQGRAHDV